ncbi:hypothetical protein [Flavobacterium sp.]|uniref:hypothetical protein n=1 Tax=Flavobacterium sp. TaxID=239 RepID=UPI0039E4FB18
MKKEFLFKLVLLLFGLGAWSQDLTIPNTPAFSILDHEPSSVMRPASVKKLSSDLLNSFDKDGKLIMDVGIEVLPYWLKNRPALTREQYLYARPMQNFLQSLAISAAMVKDTVTNENNLGVGFRFQLFQGRLTPQFDKVETDLKTLETMMGLIAAEKEDETVAEAIEAIVANLEAMKMSQNISDEQILDLRQRALELSEKKFVNVAKFCEALIDSYQKDRMALAQKLVALEGKRLGLSLEAAGASKFATSGNQALRKAGLWMNLNNYTNENNAFTLTGRVFFNTTDTTAVNTDLGLSYLRMEKDFNLSVEAMARWYRMEIPEVNILGQPIRRVEKKLTYRLAAQLAYSIAREISVNLSIGKSFEDPVLSKAGFFSILGLNYSIFNQPIGQ